MFQDFLYNLYLTNAHNERSKYKNNTINWSKLPKSIAEESCISKYHTSKFVKSVFIHFSLANDKFIQSTQTLHPNLIRYFIINKACKIVEIDNHIYLRSMINNDIQTRISPQIKFGYELSNILRKYKNKLNKDNHPFNMLFDKNDNILMTCEHYVSKSGRIDFVLTLKQLQDNRDLYIGFEFLENTSHKNDISQELNKIQEIRCEKMCLFDKNVKHISFVWQKYWNKNDGYREYYIKEIERLYNIYNTDESEEKFGIEFINKYIGNITVSTMLYQAYTN